MYADIRNFRNVINFLKCHYMSNIRMCERGTYIRSIINYISMHGMLSLSSAYINSVTTKLPE